MSLAARVTSASIVAVLLLGPGDAGAQALTLEFENGLVTLNARIVSVRQILERWATIGGVTVIDGDKVSATPVTLQLDSVPEREALATLLRDVSGYIVGSRRQAGGAVAVIDRILIVPTSVAPRTALSQLPVSRPTVASEPRPEPAVTTIPQVADQVDAGTSNDPPAPLPRPRAAAASQGQPAGSPRVVPGNPFGVTSGSAQPGTISPGAPAQPGILTTGAPPEETSDTSP